MNPVKIISGIAAPFLRINVDTDAIIPSREIKAVSKKGLSEGLFSEWRYTSMTERKPNDDFVLNQDPYNRSLMLLTGDNFFSQVWHKTLGGTLPFIFNPSGGGNNNPDMFAICRFKENSLQATQSAVNVYDISVSIEETW